MDAPVVLVAIVVVVVELSHLSDQEGPFGYECYHDAAKHKNIIYGRKFLHEG